MQLELFEMLDHGHLGLAFAYSTASLLAGLLAVSFGTALVRRAGH
jgi:fluoride ion exporter CrcB/FEX